MHTQILNTVLCVHLHSPRTHTHTHTLTFSNILFCPKRHISGAVCYRVICSVVGTLQTSSHLHAEESDVTLLTLHICIKWHMAEKWYLSLSLSLSIFHVFHCAKLSPAGPNKSRITQRAQGSLNN